MSEVILELTLKPFGVSGCGHFYIHKAILDQKFLELNKKYVLKIVEV